MACLHHVVLLADVLSGQSAAALTALEAGDVPLPLQSQQGLTLLDLQAAAGAVCDTTQERREFLEQTELPDLGCRTTCGSDGGGGGGTLSAGGCRKGGCRKQCVDTRRLVSPEETVFLLVEPKLIHREISFCPAGIRSLSEVHNSI